MEESRQEISVQFVSGIGEDSFPPLKHQSIDSETMLSIDYQPQAVSRVSGGTGRPLASGSGDKTLFHGYDSDEIQEAVMKRPRIYMKVRKMSLFQNTSWYQNPDPKANQSVLQIFYQEASQD